MTRTVIGLALLLAAILWAASGWPISPENLPGVAGILVLTAAGCLMGGGEDDED